MRQLQTIANAFSAEARHKKVVDTFYQAMLSDDVKTIQRLGKKYDAKYLNAESTFSIACSLGKKTETIAALLSLGVNPAPVNQMVTPFFTLISRDSLDLVDLVLKETKVDINVRNNMDETPLMHARSTKMAEKIIAAGGFINDIDSRGWNALVHCLHNACGQNSEDLCTARKLAETLLEHGVDKNIVFKWWTATNLGEIEKSTPAIMAALSGDIELFKLIATKSTDIDIQDKYRLLEIVEQIQTKKERTGPDEFDYVPCRKTGHNDITDFISTYSTLKIATVVTPFTQGTTASIPLMNKIKIKAPAAQKKNKC